MRRKKVYTKEQILEIEVAQIKKFKELGKSGQLKNLSDVQKFFIYLKRKRVYLKILTTQRELTLTEKEALDNVNRKMFESIFLYAKSLQNELMLKYRNFTAGDADSDVSQILAATFFEHLPFYDPTISRPTTFFVSHFKGAITNYILSDAQHLTANDAKNIAKVNDAIKRLENLNVQYDEEMLKERTGLSVKVLRKTLKLAKNSTYVDVDEAINVASKKLTPEQEFLENEVHEIIEQVLDAELTQEEKTILTLKAYNDEPFSIKDIAKHLGLPARDVTKKYNSILLKLRKNKTLRQLYFADRKRTPIPIPLQLKNNMQNEERAITESFLVCSKI